MFRITSLLSSVLILAVLMIGGGRVYAQGPNGCEDNDPNTACNVFEEQCKNNPTTEICQAAKPGQSATGNGIFGADGVFTKAIGLLARVVGIAAIIMVIVGGLQYVLASGDSTNITNAKNTILYAIIGLVIAVMAQAIVSFVLTKL